MSRLKILALVHGNPFDTKSFSGTNNDVLSIFNNNEYLCGAHDIELYGITRKIIALREFSFNKKKWRSNFRLSQVAFDETSKTANLIVDKYKDDINFVFQMGAKFIVNKNKHFMIASYHDNTAALSSRGGEFSFIDGASSEYITRAIDREKKVYENNDIIFTFSDNVKKSMVNDYDINENKIHVVYGGSSILIPDVLCDTSEKFDNKNILFVGKDFSRKGGDVLLSAFDIVKKSIPKATLTIVGKNKDIKNDNIKCVGYVDQQNHDGKKLMSNLYNYATVFTMPSFFEPFGKPFCEAMMLKTPCIGTNISAIPELIDHGKTGFCITPGDQDALAKYTIQLFNDFTTYKMMSEKSYIKAYQFNWNVVVGKMINVMQKSAKR